MALQAAKAGAPLKVSRVPLAGNTQLEAPPVLDAQEAQGALAALRRRRAEMESWVDAPSKKAALTALDRVIAELERGTRSITASPPPASPGEVGAQGLTTD